MTSFVKTIFALSLLSMVFVGLGVGIFTLMQHQRIVANEEARFERFYKDQMTDTLKQMVGNEVRFIRYRAAHENIPVKTLQTETLQRLRQLRFGANDNGYFFVLELRSIDGGPGFAKELLLPVAPELEDQLINEGDVDAKGFAYRQSYLEQLRKNGEATVAYWYLKPDTREPGAKISHLYHLKEWNWVVAAGFYLDDLQPALEAERAAGRAFLKERMTYAALAVIGVTGAIGFLYLMVYSRIERRFEQYETTLKLKNQTLLEQERALNENAKIVAAGEMIKRVAHHWRQPLNAIGILIQDLIEARRAGELDETYLRENTRKAMEIITRMSRTIDQFRGFLEDEKEGVFELGSLVEQGIFLMRPEFEEANIRCEREAQSGAMTVRGSSALFGRAFFNVLLNAKEALERSDKPDKTIRINLQQVQRHAHLRISDNGDGISAALQPQIFLPYFSTKGPRNGTGLGLYAVKEIIEGRMDGSVNLQTGPEGTTVIFILPLA